MRRNSVAAVFVVLILTLGTAGALPPQPIESFTAYAASLGTGRTGVVDIQVYRWSTDEEREALLTTLQEFGPDRLLEALEKIRPPVGIMKAPGGLGWDLYYARNNPQPDGSRRVVMATNRWVSFREASANPRSMQYQFTLIEMRLDSSGKGEGKLVPAAKVSWNHESKKLEIENYNNLPVDLLEVKAKP